MYKAVMINKMNSNTGGINSNTRGINSNTGSMKGEREKINSLKAINTDILSKIRLA